MYSFLGTFTCGKNKTSKEFFLRTYKNANENLGKKEFEALKVLKEQNLPVPAAYYFEKKCPVIKKPFMIMEKIVGKNASTFFNNEKTAKFVVENMAKTLVKIHRANISAIKNTDLFLQGCTTSQQLISETMFFANKQNLGLLGFSPPRQRRFISAVKKIGFNKHIKVDQKLIHADYYPNHVIVSNNKFFVIDWGASRIGDADYDVAQTYHKLRIVHKNSKIDFGKYFVNCYEEQSGQKLVNLQFFKDTIAIELAKWSGLSPFRTSRVGNYFRVFSLFFGDIYGEIQRAKYVKGLKQIMEGHHTSAMCDIKSVQDYSLQYLEKDRFEQ